MCMVASRGADDAFPTLVARKVGHLVIGAAKFEGEDRLQIFAFEEDVAF